jgi:4-hydroxy-2-oxoglutarate aldolase
MSLEIKGVFPPIPTPFDADGNIMYDKVKSNIAKWLEAGLQGFVVLGTNGEYVMQTDDEKAKLFETARQAIPSDKFFFAGTGCESTRATIALTKRAAEIGADAVMVVTPHYYKSQINYGTLVNHYRIVADASPKPVLIYNMPPSTGIDMDAATVIELAKHPNIIGIKDSSGNVTKYAEILRSVRPDFALLAGSGSYLYASMMVGAKGAVAALANVAPRPLLELYNLIITGQHDKARELQYKLMPLNSAVTTRYSVPGLKAALNMLDGFDGGFPRLPLRPLGEEQQKEIRQLMKDVGVI